MTADPASVSIAAQIVPRQVTVDELVALSDEIAALARAGVPLDRGLLAFGNDVPARLGKLASDIGQRLEKGEELSAVITSSGCFPPAYQAIVAAGIRAGQLPAALEDIARSARRARQLRSSIGVALIYPAIVLTVAYSLFVFGIGKLLPVMVKVGEAWDIRIPYLPEAAAGLQATLPIWGPIVPILAACLFAWLWLRSEWVAYSESRGIFLRRGLPGSLSRMRMAGQLASLNELLAMLLEHGVPLPEALPLAAAAVGSPPLERGARELAERLARGEMGGAAPRGFPPLLAWTLASASAQPNLPEVLRRSAACYRDEAARRAHWAAIYFPLVLTIGVGGGTVVVFALLTLAPWLLILYRMTELL